MGRSACSEDLRPSDELPQEHIGTYGESGLHVLAELAARSVEKPSSATRVARSSVSESTRSGGLMDARPDQEALKARSDWGSAVS